MCVFCEIIKGNIPCKKIYENDNILAFLDINPVTIGHTLIIPKKHYANFLEMPIDEFATYMQDVKKIAHHITKALNIEGFNMLTNTGSIAGQSVHHLHFHIVPRREGDIFKIPHVTCQYNFDEILEKLVIKNKSL